MRTILSKLGAAILIIIFIPFVVLLLIVMSPVILWFIALDPVAKILARLRHDPVHVSAKRYQLYGRDTYPETERELKDYFDRYLTLIKKDCNINSDIKVMIEGMRGADNIESAPDHVYDVMLSVVLAVKGGKASIRMEANGNPRDGILFSSTADGDSPPYLEATYSQKDGLRTVFQVSGSATLEFLVASLNNGQYMSKAGQVWVKLKDGLCMVNYSRKKSDKSDRIGASYGYRHELSDRCAREYFFDKKQ